MVASWSPVRSLIARASDHIVVLALVAAGLALIVPSSSVAARSDLLLAVLVLLTALTLSPSSLLGLHHRLRALAALSIGPYFGALAVAWLISRPFTNPTQDGILALGLSSTEVASVGLVALAGGDAALVLGALTGSLITAAILGPLLAGVLAATAGHAGSGGLLVRFALVVLLPLAVGLAARWRFTRIGEYEDVAAGLSSVTVCALVYAALSGLDGGNGLLSAALGSLAFLLACGLLALAATRVSRGVDPAAVGLATGLRDFAVAAALATQAFGPRAATVSGLYGVLMLISGALIATRLRGRGSAG